MLQADVFSLGVILFELFLRKTLAADIMEMDDNPGQIEMFAYKVVQCLLLPLSTRAPGKDFPSVQSTGSPHVLL